MRKSGALTFKLKLKPGQTFNELLMETKIYL